MKIAVYGSASGDLTSEIKEKAREIGREIACLGHTIITGGTTGLPYEAVLGATELNGESIAFSPATNLENHEKLGYPTEPFTKFIFIPEAYAHAKNPLVCKKYRNVSSVAETDIAIIIGGRIGTMNEFTIAYDLGKNIGILDGSGGITHEAIESLLRDANKQSKSKITRNPDPVALLNSLCNAD